ncbi:MAG: TlyA family RNA methyltransferase [Alphaproteobacteria bacterium]|nr:TlyA family RNA methyltransferase [Alphaproteobacteria bacterium]
MRADRYLVEQGYFETRAKAQAAIEAGGVRVNGAVLTKPSQKVPDGAVIQAEPAHPYVSRAALKLLAGLDAFGVDPAGLTCLDVGSSTGGFTQVLLERGAAFVAAVDVGRDQLHASLHAEPRVLSLEGTDARTLMLDQIGGRAPELVVCDASFISLEKVLARPLELAAAKARLIALFKPQFEVGRAHVGKGGLVKDAEAVERAEENARAFLARAGFKLLGSIESPITGGDGNRERLIFAVRA